MNLILRLIIIIIKCLRTSHIHLLAESKQYFRCLPTDCDINLHMTNSRYLSFMDLGRLYLSAQLGVAKLFYKEKWSGVINAIELTFIRPIKPFQKFKLVTRIIAWDEKYYYFEQKFIARRTLCAIALVRGVFLHHGKKVPMEKIQQIIGENVPAPEFPLTVQRWKELMELKKSGMNGGKS